MRCETFGLSDRTDDMAKLVAEKIIELASHFTFCIAAAICAFWLTPACCQEAAKQPKLNSEVERCRRINNEHMRTRCLEEINSKAAPVPQQQPAASATWQLARTPNPSGGPAFSDRTMPRCDVLREFMCWRSKHAAQR
jgi:hypothetical protein